MSETSIHNMYSICWWNGDYAWFNSSFWLIHNFDNNLYYDPLTVNHLFIFIMSRVVDENKVQLDLKNFVTDCVIPLNVESKVQRLAWEGVKWENNMIYIFNISLLRTTVIFLYSFIFVYLFPPNPAIRWSKSMLVPQRLSGPSTVLQKSSLESRFVLFRTDLLMGTQNNPTKRLEPGE